MAGAVVAVIAVDLRPEILVVGRATSVVVSVANDGRHRCSRIGFDVRLPPGVRCERGRRTVTALTLAPGESFDEVLVLRPTASGPQQIEVVSVRFVEKGVLHRAADRILTFCAVDPPTAEPAVPTRRGSRPGVFISYRHGDVDAVVAKIAATVERRYEAAVFHDRPALDGGDRWEERLVREIDASTVVLVVVGSRWTTGEFVDRRRLHERGDWVAREVVLALADRRRTIIPIPVDTVLPAHESVPEELRGLWERQAAPLWTGDDGALAPEGVERLLRALDRYLAQRVDDQ